MSTTLNKLTTRILLLNGSQTVWGQLADYVLMKGEPAVEFITDVNEVANGAITKKNFNTVKVKVGDGVTAYKDLPYVGDELAQELATLVGKVNGLEDTVAELGNAVFQINAEDLATVTGDNEAAKIVAYLTSQDEDLVLKEGNIAVVKKALVTGLHSYTAYVYNGTAFVAMDGNYNAENVYFDEDMLFTYAFGKYKLSNGNVTIPSAGKNLKELLMSAHVDIIDPSSTSPSFSLNATDSFSQEVGTSYDLPSATATFTDGSYTYGYVGADGNKVTGTNQKAGIVADKIVITCTESNDSKTVEDANTGTLTLTKDNLKDNSRKDLIVKDTSVTYNFSASCEYSASTRTPTNNVGETSNSETGTSYSPIAGGEWSSTKNNLKTDSCTVSGWRRMFMGTVDSTNTNTEIDTTLIRSTMNKLVNAQVSTSAQTFTVPVGATKIIVACPDGYVISKCEYFTMSWETIANFPHLKDADDKDKMVPVSDARGGTNGLKNYHVYVFTHSSPSGFEAATQYRVTLKKG